MSMTKKTFKLFFHEAWQFRKRTIFCIVSSASNVMAASFLAPFIISQFLDKLQAGADINIESMLPLIIGYTLAQIYGEVIGWRLTLLSTWTMETAAQRNLYNKIFSHLTEQSMGFHSNRFGGSLVSQTNKLVGSFERFWDTIIFQLTPSITSVFAAVIILMFVFWQYAVFLLIISIIFATAVVLGSITMAKLNIRESQASTKLTGRLADVITNIMAVKSHGHEAYEIDQYDNLSMSWRKRSLEVMWGFLKVSTVYSSLIVVLNVSALVAAIIASEKFGIAISTVYLSVAYTLTVARQLWEMNNIMRNYNRIMGDAYDMVEILSIVPSIMDTNNPIDNKIIRGSIQFEKVNFAHDTNGNLFSNLNLVIKPGEKVGLVGHSGSGKTTLTKLLLRFMDIDSGTIRIDGQDISKLRQSKLRSHIAYVPQEPILFHRTLAENIGYGQLGSSKRAIITASKLANADGFISKLPDGYDTLVGERGVKLSGGQRQRVAIARAMLKNAPILLLDEATSALDSESEELIQDALWKLMDGRTTIVIAHRLSTIQKMDRILVMDNGKIIEEGTHKELVRQNGSYANLWQKQSGGFIED